MQGLIVLAAALFLAVPASALRAEVLLTPQQELGKMLFFDDNLSNPPGQSCASCHDPGAGFADPDNNLPVSEGVLPGRFGPRNSPTAAYAAFSPNFSPGKMQGGQFWDGRARDLKEQAQAPFLNPVEMHHSVAGVVEAVRFDSAYYDLFEEVYPGLLFGAQDETIYAKIAEAIAAYEKSGEVNRFTSKFDAFWRAAKSKGIKNPAGLEGMSDPTGVLSNQEFMGFQVFKGKGKCINCHTLDNLAKNPSSPPDQAEFLPVFTDYKYHNLGIPKNPRNPWYDMPAEFNPDGADFIDLGLARNPAYKPGTKAYEAAKGRFKTPTLRNVAKTAPYGHNGVFSWGNPRMNPQPSLMMIVHFYNTRDVEGEGWPMMGGGMGGGGMGGGMNQGGFQPWPPPEVPQNVNRTDMGNLGLTQPEGMALVQFLYTLSDGYTAEP